jgi:hypothetical protein
VPEKPKQEEDAKENIGSMAGRLESLTIAEDVKENEPEDDEGLPIYPYDLLKTTAAEPVTEIDVTRREVNINIGYFQYFLLLNCETPRCNSLNKSSECRPICLRLSSKRSLEWQRKHLASFRSGSRTE